STTSVCIANQPTPLPTKVYPAAPTTPLGWRRPAGWPGGGVSADLERADHEVVNGAVKQVLARSRAFGHVHRPGLDGRGEPVVAGVAGAQEDPRVDGRARRHELGSRGRRARIGDGLLFAGLCAR